MVSDLHKTGSCNTLSVYYCFIGLGYGGDSLGTLGAHTRDLTDFRAEVAKVRASCWPSPIRGISKSLLDGRHWSRCFAAGHACRCFPITLTIEGFYLSAFSFTEAACQRSFGALRTQMRIGGGARDRWSRIAATGRPWSGTTARIMPVRSWCDPTDLIPYHDSSCSNGASCAHAQLCTHLRLVAPRVRAGSMRSHLQSLLED